MIELPILSARVQDVAQGDWNIKRGGKAFGVFPLPEFKVLVAETDSGVVEFAVPDPDLQLVTTALGADRALGLRHGTPRWPSVPE